MNTKNNSFLKSLQCALEGLRDAFVSERNLKIHAMAIVLVVALGVLFTISRTEWIVCIALFGLVVGAELMNTALEIVVDLFLPQRDSRAKRVKDTAAAAVLVVSLAAGVAGIMIFLPKVWAVIG